MTNIFTDAADLQEELAELKTTLNDCDIQTNIAKRKNELSKFASKLDMMDKEFQNLKKSCTGKEEDGIKSKLNQIGKQLKQFQGEKSLHDQFLLNELEALKPIDFLDFAKNHQAVKKVRDLRTKIQESERGMKDLEKLQKEAVRKIAEQDMENSIVMQGLKAQQLAERLASVEARLKSVSRSGDEMDGNTSNTDEEEFIDALRKEMPEVLANITYTFQLLKDVDKLLVEVKHSMDVDLMAGLQDKISQAGENVDEAEALLNQLEQEIFNWNASKKLQRRDVELADLHDKAQVMLEELTGE